MAARIEDVTDTLSEPALVEVGCLIAKAFEKDPIVRFLMGCEYNEDTELWNVLATEPVRAAKAVGRIFLAKTDDGDSVGAAICFGPGRDRSQFSASEDFARIQLRVPDEQAKFLKQFELDERELFKVYPEGFKLKQWYILNLIVREDWRGRGIGSALLKRVSEEATSTGSELVLDTSTPTNVRFYRGRGLKLANAIEMSHWRFGPLPKMFTLSSLSMA